MLIASVATAACLLILVPASAWGDTGTAGAGSASCPASNPPNQMTLAAGTPQTTMLDTEFATALQVALSASDGCAVTSAAGVPVTFRAPSRGASGVFSGSGSNSITVGSDVSGAVNATSFTANDTSGSYTVTATSRYGSVSFSLTNTANGVLASIVAVSTTSSSATVSTNYAQPLGVKVADANGDPVAGAAVTFTLGTANTTNCAESTPASATFTAGAGTQATATTDTSGVAISPLLTANSASGTFTATAAISSSSGGTAGQANAESQTAADDTTPVTFRLANLAGAPVMLTSGAGLTEAAPAGGRFPMRLRVTVADAENNPVTGAPVVFTAPTAGPSGRFIIHHRGRQRHRKRAMRRRVVVVRT
ncbi:MAG: hypothetical protein ACRDNS_11410, partial [Trebonia sp.]